MNIFHIFSILCLALCFIMFLYLKWDIKKRMSSSGLLANELDERKTEVAKLIAEIDRITDRDSMLVEDRVNKLKTILHDVDKRIEMYEKELEQNFGRSENPKKNETLYTSLGRGIHAALNTPEVIAEPALLQAVPPMLPPELPPMPPPEPKPEPKPAVNTVKPPSKKQIRAHIDILINEGLTPDEIASQLEISVAEVNLAMNLRRRI